MFPQDIAAVVLPYPPPQKKKLYPKGNVVDGKRSVGGTVGWHILNFNLKQRCLWKTLSGRIFLPPLCFRCFLEGKRIERQQIDTQVGRIQVCYMLICVCVYVYMYIWCLVSIYTSEKSHKTWSFQLFSKRQSSLKPSFWRFPCQIFPRCIHTYRRYIYIYTVQRPATLAPWYHPKDQLWKSLVG